MIKFLFFIFSISIFSKTIYFTDYRTFKYAEIISKELNFESKNKLLFSSKINPHDYSPNSLDIKKLKKIKYLIIGPINLSPWLKSYLKHYSGKRIYLSNFISFKSNIFNKINVTEWSHFWLNPVIKCKYFNQLKISLLKLNGLQSSNHKCTFIDETKRLKGIHLPQNIRFVLSHDSLAIVLTLLKKDFIVISSSNGHHHGNKLGSKKLKEITNFIDNEHKYVWIEDPNFPFNSYFNKYSRNKKILFKNMNQLLKELESIE